MKRILKERKKLGKKGKATVGLVLVLMTLLVIGLVDTFVTSRQNRDLESKNAELEAKVNSLQESLRRLSEEARVARDSMVRPSSNSGGTNDGSSEVLARMGLIASPSETRVMVDAPAGWELTGENTLKKGGVVMGVQSEDIDLFSVSSYSKTKLLDTFNLPSGQTVYLVMIQPLESNSGYLSLSSCNPEVGPACSFKSIDGKFIFILAHSYQTGDQFVRETDFNSNEGANLIKDFKVMMRSLEIEG
jgi:hypothetical protein